MQSKWRKRERVFLALFRVHFIILAPMPRTSSIFPFQYRVTLALDGLLPFIIPKGVRGAVRVGWRKTNNTNA